MFKDSSVLVLTSDPRSDRLVVVKSVHEKYDIAVLSTVDDPLNGRELPDVESY